MNAWPRALGAIGLLALAASCSAGDGASSRGTDAQTTAERAAAQVDWAAVEAAMGRPGTRQPGGEYRFNMPRTDLTVTVRGIRIRPALSLGSWVAFMPSGHETVVMGDLVLTQEEYNAVIARLQDGGIGQTAIHKHLPEHAPDLWWTHVHGRGDPVLLAATIREAMALTTTPTTAPPLAAAMALDIDTAQIRTILGRGGSANGGVYNVAVARAETIRAAGIEVPPAMGMATVLNFQPTGGGEAVINGDFALLPGEVDDVVRTLRLNGIEVVSIHNHTSDEEPRLVFVHFWANGDALALARGLRAALDLTNVRP